MRDALVELLGKPISASSALVVPTAISPFSTGPQMAGRLIRGEVSTQLTELGWEGVGVLELTALPTVEQEVCPTVRAADARLCWVVHCLRLRQRRDGSGPPLQRRVMCWPRAPGWGSSVGVSWRVR